MGQCLSSLLTISVVSLILAAVVSNTLHRRLSLRVAKINRKLFLLSIGLTAFILTFLIYNGLFHHGFTILDLDEVGYLFQAENFSIGRLSSPAPPENLQKFFDTFHVVIYQGKIFGKYPFGHCLLLMLGILVGELSLIPSLIAGLNVMLNYLLAKEVYDQNVAIYSSLLCLLSPFFLGYSSTLLVQGTSLLFISLFFLFFVKFVKKPGKILYPLLSGLFLGMEFNTSPKTAIAISLPFVLYSLYLLMKEKRRYVKGFVLVILSFGLMLAAFLSYNRLLTGDPLVMPYLLYCPHDRPGFGPEMGGVEKEWGPPAGHTLMRGIRAVPINIVSMNQWLGWGYPISLVFMGLLFLKGRKNAWDWISLGLAGSVITVIITYWGMPYIVRTLGTIYYFEALLPLTLLAGRGINGFMKEGFPLRQRFLIFFLLLSLVACLYSLKDSLGYVYRRTRDYDQLKQQICLQKIHHGLIFVPTEPYNPKGVPLLTYPNHPSFDHDIVYALDLGNKKNRELMNAYGGRDFYLWENDSGRLRRYCPERD